MSDPAYEIYALKYAHHDRHSRENFLVEDPHDGPQPLAYYVWVIVGDGRTILVDTGFDETMAKKRRRTITRPVVDGLRALGVAASSIEDIILTHLHYDHVGTFHKFPRPSSMSRRTRSTTPPAATCAIRSWPTPTSPATSPAWCC